MLSCKHLCCREGVDKAPKPPKNSFVSASSLVVPSSLTAKTSSDTIVAARRKNPKSKTPGPGNAAKIEAVDLTNGRDRYADHRPEDFRKLSQLHESVTQGSSTPLIPRTKPTSEFKGWDQSKTFFLNKVAAIEDSNDKPSTGCRMGGLPHGRDHMGGVPADSNWMGGLPSDGNRMDGPAVDSTWMGDLPSASVLSASQDRHHGPSQHDRSTDYGSDWQSDLPSLSALLGENIPMDETPYKNNSLEDFDLSPSDKDKADLEDAMIGFSDSVAIQNDSQAEAANTSTNLQSDHQFQTFYERPIHGVVASEKSHALGGSCLSTDSHDKPIEPPRKRKVFSASDKEDVMLTAPVAKRVKTSKESDQALQASSDVENKAETGVPVIKPGQPAWVYQFDPAFIAEYQDFVEFV